MSNYTKATNFATKDALSSGNPLKIVKGTEINTEFDAIATAIATKADTASPTFTGTPSLPTGTTGVTQSAGNNTTALATTAFVTTAMQTAYPIGSIYISTVSTNPNTLFGFGTWVAFGAGRVLIGNGGGFTAGATGGSADAVVVSHTHTATTTSTDSGHTHQEQYAGGSAGGGNGMCSSSVSTVTGSSTYTATGYASITSSTTVDSTGVSGTNANLQPYVVVYMWNRTA